MLVHSSVTPITYRKWGDVATVVHREFLLECCDVVLRTQRSALHGYAGRPGDQTTPQVSHQGARKADQAKGSGRLPKPVCRSKICGVSPTEPHRRPKGQTQPQSAQQEKGGIGCSHSRGHRSNSGHAGFLHRMGFSSRPTSRTLGKNLYVERMSSKF